MKKNQISIAIIGLVGVLVTAVLSNIDKLFPPRNLIKATRIIDHTPTSNFQAELTYFFQISGTRSTAEITMQALLANLQNQLLQEHPEQAKEILASIDAANKELPGFIDEVIRRLMPVYEKNYTIAEINALNNFYSTEVMQDMVKKSPSIVHDSQPIMAEFSQEFGNRVLRRIGAASAK